MPWHIEEGPSAVRAPEGWLLANTASDADAAFIVRACNSHYELLEALRAVLSTGLNGGNNMRLAYIAAGGKELSDELLAKAEQSEQAVQKARAAIARATGAA